jgi:hypothetical protein
VSEPEKRVMDRDRCPPLKPLLHPVDDTEATLFVVLILIVRLRLLLQIPVVLRWLVLILLSNPRHIYLVLYLYIRVNVSSIGIRAGSPRLILLIEAAVAV